MVNSQKGLSLVELMVAMVLGLLISAAVLQLFLTNRQTFNLQQGTASVLEQGQFAVDFLTKELMSAGFGDVTHVIGSDAGESSDGDAYDSIRIFLEEGKDCAGAEINETIEGEEPSDDDPWKHYSVSAEGVLICTDSDGNRNPLIDNVEAFQILYGISTSLDDVAPNYYASLTDIGSQNIVSIRFAIVIASDGVTNVEGEVIGQHDSDSEAMQVLDQSYAYSSEDDGYLIDFEDRRLRRLFVSTVAIRNVAGG